MEEKMECDICNKNFLSTYLSFGTTITTGTFNFVKKGKPNFKLEDKICLNCLNGFRSKYIQHILEEEKGKLTKLEKEVINSIRDQEIISEDVNQEFNEKLKLGDRIADRVAEFGGSWKFIILFGFFLILWMTINSVILKSNQFDPFPYILLNLVLSCLTAMQAPIIMMSQNRQSEKERLKAQVEYQINLKAELQTRQIMRKLDLFMTQQWQSFLEVQHIQEEMKHVGPKAKD